MKRIEPQYIAALGAPGARSGTGAEAWGLWTIDPGPRGVRLRDYRRLKAAGGVAPERWKFDAADWWLEENGLIMEQPRFPLPAGRYLVTGAREKVAVLTVHPAGKDGAHRWELDSDATLHDVTHLGCRSARYRPLYKQFFWIFVACCIGLGWLGSRPAEGGYVIAAQILTAYYFLHFLVILPLLGLYERPLPRPASIAESVLGARREGAHPAQPVGSAAAPQVEG